MLKGTHVNIQFIDGGCYSETASLKHIVSTSNISVQTASSVQIAARNIDFKCSAKYFKQVCQNQVVSEVYTS